MSNLRILKNNTAQDVSLDIGHIVPASGQLEVDPANYLLIAKSNTAIEKLSDGTLTLNNGIEDIADLNKAIQILIGVAIPNVEVKSIPPISTEDILAGLDITEFYENEIDIQTTYTTVFQKNSKGIFKGLKLDVSNEDVDVRISIDSTVIFEANLKNLSNFGFDKSSSTGIQREFGFSGSGEFEYFPSYPMLCNSSFLVEVKKDRNGNRDVDKRLLIYRVIP